MDVEAYCAFCFDVLAWKLEQAGQPTPPSSTAGQSCPLFVTWKKWSSKHQEYDLRGCIGTFAAQPLAEGLQTFTCSSAFRDSRFPPIRADELPALQCGVSLLTNFTPGADYLDWEVGRHGIWIEFPLGRDTTTATYLPEVAAEQGWTKEEAIQSLLRKGGHRGPITPELLQAIKLTRYESQKASLNYDDWKRRRAAP